MKHDLSYCCCFEISWQVVQVIVNAYCQRLRNVSSWDVPAYGSYLNPRQEQWSSSSGEPLLRLYLCCFCFSCLLWCQSICFPVIQLNVFKLKKKCCNREFIKSERKKKIVLFRQLRKLLLSQVDYKASLSDSSALYGWIFLSLAVDKSCSAATITGLYQNFKHISFWFQLNRKAIFFCCWFLVSFCI